jgi:tetratricopeptide (TPR) repeat protein
MAVVALLFCLPLQEVASQNAFQSQIDVYDLGAVRQAKLDNMDKAQPIAAEAETAFKQGDFDGAISLYERALALATHPRWYYELGNSLFSAGAFRRSEETYMIAVALGFDRPDFAYYNAACSASMRRDDNRALFRFEQALTKGYRYLGHLRQDPDIAHLRALARFESLIDAYFPPSTIASPEAIRSHFSEVESSSIAINRVDDTEGQTSGLIVLVLLPESHISEVGSYYFAYYARSGNSWTLVNRTSSNLRSLPELDTDRHAWSRIPSALPKPSAPPFVELDIEFDGTVEFLVPSWGLSYWATKVLDIHDGMLRELGEIEGLTDLYRTPTRMVLVGHRVTDLAHHDGTSEQHSGYSVSNGELIRIDLAPSAIHRLYDKKKDRFEANPSLSTLSALFWFAHNHRPNVLSADWVEVQTSQLDPSSRSRDFAELMLARLRLDDTAFESWKRSR